MSGSSVSLDSQQFLAMVPFERENWIFLMSGFLKNKFGNKPASSGGRSFQSKAERDLFTYLDSLQRVGAISNLKCQTQVHLTDSKILYKPDFSFEENGVKVWAEMKGFETDVWRIKRRLWMHYGPGELRIYKKLGQNISLTETIKPKGENHEK